MLYIVVAGKYRTGKSFLLNRIILGKIGEGFGVGPTINPCTKGLWVWNEVIETEHNGEKLKVLIIDSEGIGAFDEDQNHDTKVFLFALLLSSYFIYNSMGTIDENAINNLSLIINLSKNLHVQADTVNEEDPEELAKYFPRFLWVLRDFSLKLRDEYDNPINSKEYFEGALNPQKGISEKVESRNRIRRLIKHFFTDRDCATLVRPTEEETDLQALQTLPDEWLRPEFVEASKKLREKIFKRVKPKTLNGKFITGEMLLELCHSYTKAINQGSVPSIKSAWSYVCQNECQRAMDESINNYEVSTNDFLKSAKEAQNIEILKQGESHVREKAVSYFRTKAVGGDSEEFEFILRKELNKKFGETNKQFNRYWQDILEKKSEYILKQIKRDANFGNSSDPNAIPIKDQILSFRKEWEVNPPHFDGKIEWILEKCLSLSTRFAESSAITDKQEAEAQVKVIKSRWLEIENSFDQYKSEKEHEITSLKSRLETLQANNTELLVANQIYEQKSLNFEAEKEKIELKYSQKIIEDEDESSKVVEILEAQNSELIELLKTKEEQHFAAHNKLSKLNALLEQKMQMVEQSLKEVREEKESKENEFKEILTQGKRLRKENDKLVEDMKKDK